MKADPYLDCTNTGHRRMTSVLKKRKQQGGYFYHCCQLGNGKDMEGTKSEQYEGSGWTRRELFECSCFECKHTSSSLSVYVSKSQKMPFASLPSF